MEYITIRFNIYDHTLWCTNTVIITKCYVQLLCRRVVLIDTHLFDYYKSDPYVILLACKKKNESLENTTQQ